MKILLLHNFYKYKGGEDTYYYSLKTLLERNGHKVIEFIKSNNDIPNSNTAQIGVARNLLFNQSISRELNSLITSKKPDIAHFNNIFPLITPTAYNVCHQNNIPIVQTMHNYRLLCPKGTLYRNGKVCTLCINKSFPFYAMFYKCYHESYPASAALSSSIFIHKLLKTFNHIDLFLFPSIFSKELHVNNSHLFKNKSAVLPYFVENDFYNFKKNDYFVYAGRLSEEKGILQLLKVFSTLPPEFKLIILGDGPLKKNVKKYTNKSNIKLITTASPKNVLDYMSKALCTIIPSRWYETGPMVMLESYSVGTPVIVPRTVVFKNTVEENKSGYFYENDDLDSLKLTIIKAYGQKNTISKMYTYSRHLYTKKYTSDEHYKVLIEQYSRIMNLKKFSELKHKSKPVI